MAEGVAYLRQAEWEFRHEVSPQDLVRLKGFHADHENLSSFDPSAPWGAVLMTAVTGTTALEFWGQRLETQARRFLEGRGMTSSSWVARQEAAYLPSGGEGLSARGYHPVPAPPQDAHMPTKKQRRAERAAPLSSKGPNSKGRGGKKSNAGERLLDGRYKFVESGLVICWRWNRSVDGRSTVCNSSPPWAHACEWRRGQHRAVSCPAHPGWPPPMVRSGKGGKHT